MPIEEKLKIFVLVVTIMGTKKKTLTTNLVKLLKMITQFMFTVIT